MTKKKQVAFAAAGLLLLAVVGIFGWRYYRYHTPHGVFSYLYGSENVRRIDGRLEFLEGVYYVKIDDQWCEEEHWRKIEPATEMIEYALSEEAGIALTLNKVGAEEWSTTPKFSGYAGNEYVDRENTVPEVLRVNVAWTAENTGDKTWECNLRPRLYQRIGGEWYCIEGIYSDKNGEFVTLSPGETQMGSRFVANLRYFPDRLPKGRLCLYFSGAYSALEFTME